MGKFCCKVLKHLKLNSESAHSADIFAAFSHPLKIDGTLLCGKFAHIECNDDYSKHTITDCHFVSISEMAKILKSTEDEIRTLMGIE